MLPALAAGLIGAAIWKGHRTLSRAIRQTARPEPAAWPSLTIVRPIRGLDVGARRNLDALFELDYPADVDMLLVLDDETDPAYPLCVDVVKQYESRGARVSLLLAGTPPEGRTGKLHAMMAGLSRAQGELVAFSDSDTRVTSEQVRQAVATLLQERRAGDAFSPVVVRWEEGRPSAGDVGFALLLNGWYGPSAALAAGAESDLPFIMGQFMVFRRETLDAIGGLACADGQLVDDMWLGVEVVRAGLRNVQTRSVLPIVTGGLSLGGFLRTFRRWLLFSRSGLPSTFTRPHWVRGALYGGSLVLLGAALKRRDGWGAVMASGAAVAFVASEVVLHRRHGGQPIPLRHLWVPAAVPILGGAVMLSALFSRTVDWRGRSYRLDAGARLAGNGVARTTLERRRAALLARRRPPAVADEAHS